MAEMTTQNRAVLWRAVILAGFLIVVIVLGLTVPLPSVTQIRQDARVAGFGGAVLFVVIYALVTLTPIPKSVISIAAGVTWGLGIGLGLVYVGALLGATLAFALGRALGRDAVERFTGARVEKVDTILRRRGLLTVIGARLIPVLPFTVINYVAGLTSLRRRDYAIGTMVGIIPGTMSYVALGAFGTTVGWGFYLAAGVLGLLTLAGVFVGYRARRSNRRNAAPGDSSQREFDV